MKKAFKFSLFLALFFCFGCNTEKSKQPSSKEHSITLIKLGLDFDGLNSKQARGFGVNYYCFVDLQTDSIFIRQEESLGSEYKEYSTINYKSGFITDVGNTETIIKGITAIDSLPFRYTKGLENYSCKRKSNVPYFIRYVNGDSKKEVFFCLNESVNIDFIYLVNTLFQISDLTQLSKLKNSTYFNEDSVTLKILKYKVMDSVPDQPKVVKVRRVFQ